MPWIWRVRQNSGVLLLLVLELHGRPRSLCTTSPLRPPIRKREVRLDLCELSGSEALLCAATNATVPREVSRMLVTLYDGGIAYEDQQIGLLCDT